MATDILNPKPLDYLGHPCLLSPIIEQHEESIRRAQAMQPREVRRQIGILLREYLDAVDDGYAALELAHDALDATGNAEKPAAVVGMVLRNQVPNGLKLFEAVGYLLAVLEADKSGPMGVQVAGHA